MDNGINIDPAEIEKFGRMAAHWWDPEGELKPLHDINPLRLDYIRSRTELEGAQVLDVGCGGGLLSEAMAAAGARVTGIDMGKDPLAAAELHRRKAGLDITYRQATVEETAVHASGRFDVVTCMELLEHVPDPGSVVAACGELVKPGGDIIFATLNRNPKSFVFAILGAEYILGLLEKGTHQYGKFVKPRELARWAEFTNLRVQDVTGLHYNPFTRRYSLGGNTHVNYLMHLRRPL
ncbi:MAG: bifunctional 2-polyprenyl-6-hydroxyphenol methylase/3-demethylubiquinol 3-O-methyltransferase UbiG [Thermodesulfobacteriota bacterium]